MPAWLSGSVQVTGVRIPLHVPFWLFFPFFIFFRRPLKSVFRLFSKLILNHLEFDSRFFVFSTVRLLLHLAVHALMLFTVYGM